MQQVLPEHQNQEMDKPRLLQKLSTINYYSEESEYTKTRKGNYVKPNIEIKSKIHTDLPKTIPKQ